MKWIPLLLIVFTGTLHAAIYKHVNEQGEVVYSDTPAPGAEKMKLPEVQTYTPPKVPLIRPEDVPLASEIYGALTFVKPLDQSTIRNNLGVIELQLGIEPALKVRENHRVQFYLDNERYGPLVDTTSIMMSNIERGEHTLSASVIDDGGNVIIASPPVTVFVKRESILHEKDEDRDDDRDDGPVNPNVLSPNPNIRTDNPNRRMDNPNKRTDNPNIISPPAIPAPLPTPTPG
jgi:hypothetical protein